MIRNFTYFLFLGLIFFSCKTPATDIGQEKNDFLKFGTNKSAAGNIIIVDKNNNIYSIGLTWDNKKSEKQSDILITKFNEERKIVWQKQIGTYFSDFCNDAKLDKDGFLYLVGTTEGNVENDVADRKCDPGECPDILIIKMKEDKIVWMKQIGSDKNDYGEGIVIDSENNIYVGGSVRGKIDDKEPVGSFDIFLMKLDGNGNKIWSNIWGTKEVEWTKSLTIDSNDNIYLAGVTLRIIHDGGNANYFVSRIDKNGNRIWTKFTEMKKYFEPSIFVGKEEDVFVVGSNDLFLTKLSSDGEIIWIKPESVENEETISASSDGSNIYIIGYINKDFKKRFFLEKRDYNGNFVDQTVLEDTNISLVGGIFIKEKDSVYITGTIKNPSLFGDKNEEIFIKRIRIDPENGNQQKPVEPAGK